MRLRIPDEQRGYLDGYEKCAENIEKYLSDEGKKMLTCLLTAVRNAVEIEDIKSRAKSEDNNEIIHCKDCKYRDYWGDCTKWSKELDALKSYILDENMFCGFAESKDGDINENRNNNT